VSVSVLITAAKARHDVLDVVYKGMVGTGLSDKDQLLAVLAGMYAISTVIEDMEAINNQDN